MINISRLPRKFKEAECFHVITQGINKEYIFSKEQYINEYLKIIRKYANELNIKIIAYCIMTNHTHFLLKVPSIGNMSKLMQKVNSLYARYYNYMENTRVGYVFRDRFVSQPITSKRYFIQCIKYIHMNPVKAKIVNSMDEYKYSSYRIYLEKMKKYKDCAKDHDILDYHDYIQICDCKENDIDFFDVDIEKDDKLIYNAIRNFLINNKINLSSIFMNREILKVLILYLKEQENIKYVDIKKFFEMKRGTMEGLKTYKK